MNQIDVRAESERARGFLRCKGLSKTFPYSLTRQEIYQILAVVDTFLGPIFMQYLTITNLNINFAYFSTELFVPFVAMYWDVFMLELRGPAFAVGSCSIRPSARGIFQKNHLCNLSTDRMNGSVVSCVEKS